MPGDPGKVKQPNIAKPAPQLRLPKTGPGALPFINVVNVPDKTACAAKPPV